MGTYYGTYVGPDIDQDVKSYLIAVHNNRGRLSRIERKSVNQLVTDLKFYSLWDKMIAIYPMIGSSAQSMAINLKTPGTFDITFVNTQAGDFTSTGWASRTTAYGRTGIIPSSHLTLNNVHIAAYNRIDGFAGVVDMGVNTAANNILRLFINHSDALGPIFDCYSTTVDGRINIASHNSATGLTIGNRRSSSFFELRKNDSSLGSKATNKGGQPTLEIYLDGQNFLGAMNNDVLTGQREWAFISFGSSFADETEADNFYNAIQTFQTTLGRQV